MQQFFWCIGISTVWCAIITVLYIPVFFILRSKGKDIIRQISYLALICSLFIIIFATLIYQIVLKPEMQTLNLTPFLWYMQSLKAGHMNRIFSEIVPNIILFIPLGIFLPIVIKNARKIYILMIMITFISFLMEFMQYFMGRSSDIDDLIMNISGGITGYVIFKLLNNIFKSRVWWSKLLQNEY